VIILIYDLGVNSDQRSGRHNAGLANFNPQESHITLKDFYEDRIYAYIYTSREAGVLNVFRTPLFTNN
jgi:hypothetical protein